MTTDALAFARWLQSINVGIIGEDVKLGKLYEQWSGGARKAAEPAPLEVHIVDFTAAGGSLYAFTDEGQAQEYAGYGGELHTADVIYPEGGAALLTELDEDNAVN